ncbi:hypothetical protein MicB006_5624 [Micromonospora sp. B006]|nr:hypothetical protein MicB006_5624 [Micromonospora sp. B006]
MGLVEERQAVPWRLTRPSRATFDRLWSRSVPADPVAVRSCR